MALLPDDGEESCPRCHRLFSVELVKAASGDLYRDAPIVDILPAKRLPPRWGGLTVQRDDEVLEVELKPWSAKTSTRAGLSTLLLCLFANLLVWSGRVDLIISYIIAGAGIAFAAPYLAQAWARKAEEGFRLDGRKVQQIQIDSEGTRVVSERSLEGVKQLREAKGVLWLTWNDGTTLAIGDYVPLPVDVRRWLLQSIASRLPEPA